MSVAKAYSDAVAAVEGYVYAASEEYEAARLGYQSEDGTSDAKRLADAQAAERNAASALAVLVDGKPRNL